MSANQKCVQYQLGPTNDLSKLPLVYRAACMKGRSQRKVCGVWGEGLGNGPPKFEVGGRPMHPSPKYFENYCYWM